MYFLAFSCIFLHFLAYSCTPLAGLENVCTFAAENINIINKIIIKNNRCRRWLAGAALYVAIKNRKQLRLIPTGCALWTQEEKDKVMQVCDVQNTNTSPNNNE